MASIIEQALIDRIIKLENEISDLKSQLSIYQQTLSPRPLPDFPTYPMYPTYPGFPAHPGYFPQYPIVTYTTSNKI